MHLTPLHIVPHPEFLMWLVILLESLSVSATAKKPGSQIVSSSRISSFFDDKRDYLIEIFLFIPHLLHK